MTDETGPPDDPAGVAALATVPVPELDGWAVRITVAHRDGPVQGWAPHLFWSEAAAVTWLRDRTGHVVRPAVRDCVHGRNDRAYACVVDADGNAMLVSEPLARPAAAAAAAVFAAEFRSHAPH